MGTPRQKFDMKTLEGKKLLTKVEATFYMGDISQPTLDKISRKPDFNAIIRVAGRVFVNRELLDQWINAQAEKYDK